MFTQGLKLGAGRFPARLAIASLLMLGMVPMERAIAANEYESCATTLAGLKASPELAARACAQALHPREIEICVKTVSGQGIAIVDALSSCNQVRRPIDLGTCITDIRGKISDAAAPEVLGNCRRSLLPVQYARCVVGFNAAVKFPAAKAMDSCLDAGYYPTELHETFLPYGTDGTPKTP